jgi:hypothetical protein
MPRGGRTERRLDHYRERFRRKWTHADRFRVTAGEEGIQHTSFRNFPLSARPQDQEVFDTGLAEDKVKEVKCFVVGPLQIIEDQEQRRLLGYPVQNLRDRQEEVQPLVIGRSGFGRSRYMASDLGEDPR